VPAIDRSVIKQMLLTFGVVFSHIGSRALQNSVMNDELSHRLAHHRNIGNPNCTLLILVVPIRKKRL
jgi:hypothetical protein